MSDAEPAAEPEPEPAAEGGVEQVEASESADGPWAPTEDALAHVAALDATRVAAQSQLTDVLTALVRGEQELRRQQAALLACTRPRRRRPRPHGRCRLRRARASRRHRPSPARCRSPRCRSSMSLVSVSISSAS